MKKSYEILPNKVVERLTLITKLSFLIIILFSIAVNGQGGGPITVIGKVTDESGSPLPNVSVAIKNMAGGTSTNGEGRFTIEVPGEKAVLIFSSVGFSNRELLVGKNRTINLDLVSQTNHLNDVVVIGYGTTKRKDLTGSVYSIKSADIVRTPTHNTLEALQGRVPGVDIARSSGNAGAGVNIRVRGNRSISGNNDPLYIIDGFQGGNPADLNPNDIESIEVLKDASATAIYGSQGANGVFIITTKKGTSGKPKITYDGFYGLNGYTPFPELRTGEDYIGLRREAYRTVGEWNSPADDHKIFPNADEFAAVQAGQWVDWFDLLARNGTQQSHTVSVKGGNEKTRAFLSAGYFKEEGMLRRNDYSRYTVRMNVDQTLAKWAKVGLISQVAFFDQNNRTDPLSLVLQTSPLGTPYDANGKVNVFPVAGNNSILSPLTDERGDTVAKNNVLRTSLLSNAYLEIQPIKGLTFRSNFGTTLNFNRAGSFQSSTSVAQRNTRQVTAQQNSSFVRAFNWDNILSYNQSFGDHNLTVTAIQSYLQNDADNLSGTGNNQLLSSQLFYNLGAADALSQRVNSGYEGSNNLAYAARVNYAFKSKYLLALTGRADGASRLSPGNKWDYFPSISGAWNISDENFMKNIGAVSNMKLRASYGTTGNYGISVYGTQSVISAASNMAFGESQATYYSFNPRVGNAELKWEHSATTNIGLDFSLLKNRLAGSIDVYNTITSGIIYDRALPRSSGVSSVYQNIGETQNKGIEIALNAEIIRQKHFQWNGVATFTRNKEKIRKLITDADIISGITPETLSLLIGKPLSSFYSYNKLGVWQSDKASEAANVRFGTSPFKPGDLRVEDINGDSIIDTRDRKYIGSPVPKFVLGLQNNFSYKGIDLGIYLFFRYGQTINAEFLSRYNPSGEGNGPASFDYWTPENPTNDFPRPVKGGQIINYAAYQAINFIDGSYFKVKTVTLGYTIPKTMVSKIGAENIRLYATGNNLFTSAKSHLLANYDPERGGAETSPLNRQFVFGLNIGF